MDAPLNAPVALIIFNRPDLTEKAFQQVASVRPRQLFIIADGPRADRPGETEKCQAARAVVERIHWDCELFKNYSDTNLGCGRRPASGIAWVFEQVDRAIILEDDVIPHPTFFRFCEELLERFHDDERIMQVCGHNYQMGQKRGPYSYYFSRHSVCAGGWATWRRAWQYFDFSMSLWPELRETKFLLDVLGDAALVPKWQKLFDFAHSGKPTVATAAATDYWDFQWNFAIWSQSGMAIFPNQILVSNVGYRPDGTHTKSANHWANLSVEAMEFPLNHPPSVLRSREADDFFVEMEKQALQTARRTSATIATKVHRFIAGMQRKIVNRGSPQALF